MPEDFVYPGQELELFSKAHNWKKYLADFIKPHIKGRVLETGAGLGMMTSWINDQTPEEWVMLEPDKKMSSLLQEKIDAGAMPGNCSVINGTLQNTGNALFDTIIYIDVLEHIEDDKAELNRAAELLRPGGKLIILSPAFQFLYSPFDKAIGHFRRYNKCSLQNIIPATLTKELLRYLDTAGFVSSLTNKLLLRQKYPTQKQLYFWDHFLVPFSTISDKLFFYSFGKSIAGVWRR